MSSGRAWASAATCSIGFWHTRPAAAAAAMKAFLVNRIGDVGFAIAIFWIWAVVPNHDLSYGNVLAEATLARTARGRQDRHRAPALLGGDGQECPDPALRLAARRDGRPDAGLGPDPRRDDGHGGRLPDRPVDAAGRAGARGPGPDRGHRLRDGPARGVDRPDAERPQAGDGLFDGQPARLHVHGAGGGGRQRGAARGRGGDVPPVHPRLLQGPPLPRLRQRDARDGRRHRHAAVRRAAASAAVPRTGPSWWAGSRWRGSSRGPGS